VKEGRKCWLTDAAIWNKWKQKDGLMQETYICAEEDDCNAQAET